MNEYQRDGGGGDPPTSPNHLPGDHKFTPATGFIEGFDYTGSQESPRFTFDGIEGFAAGRDAADTSHAHDESRHYYFRPGRIVIAESSLEGVGNELDSRGFRRRATSAEDPLAEALAELGLALFESNDWADTARRVPDIVEELRGRERQHDGPRLPAIGPEHTLFAASHPVFGPGTTVEPTDQRLSDPASEAGLGVRVAVLDTGGWSHDWFTNSSVRTAESDEPDVDRNDSLDHTAGHGTFIAGVIRRYAPAAQIDCYRVLSATAHIDELEAVSELNRIMNVEPTYDIVNLSFGGPGPGPSAPLALPAAIQWWRRKHPTTVFVAAAGNNATATPFYPAAAKGVIAVGALDAHHRQAPFSNYGPWVDCWAPGDELVSTFLKWDGNVTIAPYAHGRTTIVPLQFNTWARWGGTSFAAPAVCGAISARMSHRSQSAAEAAAGLLAEARWVRGLGLVPDLQPLADVIGP